MGAVSDFLDAATLLVGGGGAALLTVVAIRLVVLAATGRDIYEDDDPDGPGWP